MARTSMFLRTAVTLMLFASAFSSAQSASAAEPSPSTAPLYTAEDITTIRARMTSAGIDPTTQDKLIAKIQAGEVLDSTLGKNPVREFSESTAAVVRTITVYADGSRSWTEEDRPKIVRTDVAQPAGTSVTGCTAEAGVGSWWYDNCKIKNADALSDLGFYIDYKLTNISGWSAEVRDLHGTWCQAIGAGMTVDCSSRVDRAVQKGSLPARATETYKIRTGGGVIARTGEFWIEVKNMTRKVVITPN